MEKAGVKLMLNARVALATAEGVGFQDGQFVKGGTIVCTVGSATAPVIERLKAQKEKGRLVTAPDMRLRDSSNAWAVGDCALIVNARDGQVTLTWNAVPGTKYIVQRTSDLQSSHWESVSSPLTATASLHSWSTRDTQAATAFYRIIVSQ